MVMYATALDAIPRHVCGRNCDICATAIGTAALGAIPAYSAILTALERAHNRLRTAATVGAYIEAREEIKRLRAAAAEVMPSQQLAEFADA